MVRLDYTEIQTGVYRTSLMMRFEVLVYGEVTNDSYSVYSIQGTKLANGKATDLRDAKKRLRNMLQVLGVTFHEEIRNHRR